MVQISPCTKRSICLIAFTLVVLVIIFIYLYANKNSSDFTLGGALSDSRGQRGRKLENFTYNLGDLTNKGGNAPATLNSVNQNVVRRRIKTTINSIVPSDTELKFPQTANTNATASIGDSNWYSNPFV
jgi:hypothetical protein